MNHAIETCPHCNRVETDESLSFCRADGTPFVAGPTSVGDEAGTVRLGPSSSAEIATHVLPQTTNAGGPRSTGPTTVLPAQPAKAYRERSSWLVEMRVDPVWDLLRTDERYTQLLRRIGYPNN